MILREEDDGGRVMVMSDDERVRPGTVTSKQCNESRYKQTKHHPDEAITTAM